MAWINRDDPLLEELRKLDASLLELLDQRDSAALLLEELPRRYTPDLVAAEGREQRAWEVSGLLHLHAGRVHEAFAIFWRLYQQMLAAQTSGRRIHKGMPLVWISDSFRQLGFPVHSKRYLMLTLCEDALRGKGEVPAGSTGAYFRLVWTQGLADQELRRYASEFWSLSISVPEEAFYPEALLQRIDDHWLT